MKNQEIAHRIAALAAAYLHASEYRRDLAIEQVRADIAAAKIPEEYRDALRVMLEAEINRLCSVEL